MGSIQHPFVAGCPCSSIFLALHPPTARGHQSTLYFLPGLPPARVREDAAPRQPVLSLFVLGCIVLETLKPCFLIAHLGER